MSNPNDTAQRNWQRVQDVFFDALEQPEHRRREFIAQRCGENDGLAQEVLSLLEAHDKGGTFLEGFGEAAESLLADGLVRGDAVGPFRVLETIGRGGMGTVWLAERTDGEFQQQVAIKLIKRGMDTDEILARFLRERRLLAQLEHPNIARFLDGGVTDDGLPWFAMEYVEGKPLIEYCDEQGLDTATRLHLQCKLCDAVEHAHRKLIVHRDLKPSNVLVTADGEPKLLDFGIAKLCGADDGDQQLTHSGVRVMTPLFAAPEQVLGQPVTTATDVYALGLILYELLVGALPYPPQHQSGPTLLRAIVETPAERPSVLARRTDTGAAQETTPALRQRLVRRLKGDLDRICLKAVHKEPARRYASAQALADDLVRFRKGYPVLARPDSLAYRTRRFVARNRVAVGAAALAFISLLGGLMGAVWQAQIASAEAVRAERVKRLLIDIFEVNRPGAQAGTELTAAEILDTGAERVAAQLAGEPDLQAELLQVVGTLYESLGRLDDAQRLLQRSLEVMDELDGDPRELRAQGLQHLGRVYFERGEHERSEALGRQALARFEAHSTRDRPAYAKALGDLAIALSEASKYEAADPLHRRSLAMYQRLDGERSLSAAGALHDLAQHLKWQGHFDEAEPLYRRALEIKLDELGERHESVALTQGNLGVMLGQRGDYEEAEPLLRASYDIDRRILGPEHPTTVLRLNNLSMFYYVTADYVTAEPLMREALAHNRRLFGADNERVATNLHNLANILVETDRRDEALPAHREALAIRRRVLEAAHPRIAQSLKSLGRLELSFGHVEEAERMLSEAREIADQSLSPSHPIYISVLIAHGAMSLAGADLAAAERTLGQAVALGVQHLGADSRELAEARSLLGRCLIALERRDQALPLLRSALVSLDVPARAQDPLLAATRSAIEQITPAEL
ncbi:MAG: serine/threonine-protein kinase [Pseudomonadota bacterium]